MAEVTREAFLEYLHDALTHLYNSDQLRRSPLTELFAISNRFDASSALRKVLVEAIESLKPPASEPDQSKAWRTYESLYCCFIQQLNQQVVADQLSISARQLRREQRNALEHLADLLWQRSWQSLPPEISSGSRQASPEGDAPARSTLLGELDWLMDAQAGQAGQADVELAAALAVVQPLALKNGITLKNRLPEGLPGLAVHPAALSQIFISLLGAATQAAGPGSVIVISARVLPAAVEIHLAPEPPVFTNLSPEKNLEIQNSLSVASDLGQLSGGRLLIGSSGAPAGSHTPPTDEAPPKDMWPFPIQLVLPALEQFPVLVVDDNEDGLHLLKRYAAGTRYHLVCTRDTDQVATLVETVHPQIVVLDLMMPKENGWLVLGRLRQHPLTRNTPIIICTILPQEQLALSLGASAFLKKPVSRQAFLQALDQQFSLLEPESP